MSADRERQVTQAFVAVANSLVDTFDVVDLLSGLTTECVRLLDVSSAGLLLADRRQVLHVVAASSEGARHLELFQLQREEGPCLECYRRGAPVSVADIGEHRQRWPQFVAVAMAAGFASVHALPMRLGDRVLGSLGLFGTEIGALDADDLNLGQALSHVASVALVHGRALADKDAVVDQLQTALTSRVVIEQAKGVLAQHGSLEMDEAFAVLRGYSRDHNERLTEVCRAIVSRQLTASCVLAHAHSRPLR